MTRWDEEIIDEIRSKADLVEVISDYVALKQRGQNFLGLCPFHEERTPSFSVSPDKQVFYCFGCHEGGDVFSFVMKKEGLDFPEAVEFLARRAGVTLPEKPATAGEKRRLAERQEIYRALELAARYFHALLLKGRSAEAARSYLESRGVMAEMIEEFQLGYAPGGWERLQQALAPRGIGSEVLEKAGLVIRRRQGAGHYDRFRHRLMFPIRDERGRVIGFGGRALRDEDQPKYLNSPEGPVFAKRKTWYALDKARAAIRQGGQAIVVEGYMDALTAHQFGFSQTVASLGTALTREQAAALARYAEQVVIAYDADAAGEDATLKGLALFQQLGRPVRVAGLPAGADPDDTLRREGREQFQAILDKSLPLVDYHLEKVLAECDVSRVEGKIEAARRLAPILAREQSAVGFDGYVRLFAERIGVSEAALRQELRKAAGSRAEAPGERYKTRYGWHNNSGLRPKTTMAGTESRQAKAEEDLLRLMLEQPSRRAGLSSRLTVDDFSQGPPKTLARVLFEAPPDVAPLSDWAFERLENDQEARRLLARLSLEKVLYPHPERVLEDCVAVLLRPRYERRKDQLESEIKRLIGAGEPVPPELRKELQDCYRWLKGTEGSG